MPSNESITPIEERFENRSTHIFNPGVFPEIINLRGRPKIYTYEQRLAELKKPATIQVLILEKEMQFAAMDGKLALAQKHVNVLKYYSRIPKIVNSEFANQGNTGRIEIYPNSPGLYFYFRAKGEDWFVGNTHISGKLTTDQALEFLNNQFSDLSCKAERELSAKPSVDQIRYKIGA